jgi:ATP diphosphatase
MRASRDISQLVAIMAALRTPVSGCPWDLEQTFASIAPFTLEEAYEVLDAIERGDMLDLREELGDLLLQVVFHARMAEEAGQFDLGDVIESINAKLIRRHPHVFTEARNLSPAEVKTLWGRIKVEEKAARAAQAGADTADSVLADVPLALPALMRALKLQQKASKVGFDWNDPHAVLCKLKEETAEIESALAAGDMDGVRGEVGDLLFAVANLARHLHVEPEFALRAANVKFARRFGHIEAALGAQGRTPNDANLDEMDALWNEAKQVERAAE